MHIFLLTPISKFASNREVNNDTTIFKLKEFTMRKLLEQLKLITEFEAGSLAYKSYDLKVAHLIQRIKKCDAKHPAVRLIQRIKKYDAKYFYLCYEKDNLRAYNYYKRNKFKFYAKNKNTIFVKKWIRFKN